MRHCGYECVPITLQHLVAILGSSLAFGLCPDPQCLQQPHLLAADERLVCHQAAVKGALLVVAANLGRDGVCPCHCHRVAPTRQANMNAFVNQSAPAPQAAAVGSK